jgi:hypothetical protein
MSGWSPADKYMEENNYNDFPAINNTTMYGYLPSDQIPAPSNSYTFSNLPHSLTFLQLYS